MNKCWTACLCAVGLPAPLAQPPPADSGFVLQGGTVHTIDGPVIENGSVLVRNGKIVGGGTNLTAPQGFKVIDVNWHQDYRGMIDAASMIGLEKTSSSEASDAKEMGLFNPQLH